MTTVQALDAHDITKIGIGVIVALVVIGFLLSLVITAIVGRIIIAVVVAVLGVLVWQQRGAIQDKVKSHDCNFNATFFGVHVQAPKSVIEHCPNGLKS